MNLQMLASKISDDIEEITKPTFKTYDEAFNSSRYIIQDGNVIDNETGEIVDTLDNFKLNPKKRTPLTNEEVLKQIKSEVSPEYYDKVKDFMSDDNIIDSFDLKNIKTETRKTLLDEVSNVKKEKTPIEKIKTEPKTKQVNNPQPNQPTKPQTKQVNTNQPKEPKKTNNKNIEINRRKNDNPIYDLYKRYLNTWKKGVTVYNPGWHLQNFLQNKGQNYLALGTDAFGSQKQARKMLDYIKGLSNNVDDIVMDNGIKLSGKDMADFAKQTGVAQGAQATQIMQEPRTLMPWLDEMIDNTKLMKRLSRNEETARLHHYLTQLKRGMSPDEAVQSVNKYLFDYGHKTNRERFIEDYIDPFYKFHKSYAKLLGKEALTNPSKINNILRMEREMTNSTPESSRNQNASETKFQLPFGSFTDDKNKARYDYMAKQYVFPEIQSAIPLTYDELEGKLNPLLKLAIQQIRGKGDFDTKIVDKDKAGWNEITKDDRKKEILMDVNPFVNNLPTTINKVNKVNNRKQSKKTSDLQKMELIFNYLTGNKGKHERYLDFLK